MSESSRPLWAKFGIKEGHRVAFVSAPKNIDQLLAGMPPVERLSKITKSIKNLDVIVYFTAQTSELEKRFAALLPSLETAGGLWIAYPKKASGVPTDLDFTSVQQVGLEAGLVDNKSCAVDEIWTAVRFVRRKADR